MLIALVAPVMTSRFNYRTNLRISGPIERTDQQLPELPLGVLLDDALDRADLIGVVIERDQAWLRSNRNLLACRLPGAHEHRDERV